MSFAAPRTWRSGRGPSTLKASNVPCGAIETRADPQTPHYDKAFDKGKAIILYCAAGERSALSGAILKTMVYGDVYNLGGFQDWVASGGSVETLPRTRPEP